MSTYLKSIAALTITMAIGTAIPAAYADAEDIEALAKAKISLIDAIEIAQKAKGGKASEAGIDDDCATPQYEVTIVRDNTEYEVRVHAVTGELLRIRESCDR